MGLLRLLDRTLARFRPRESSESSGPDLTGSVGAWLLDEASGNVSDIIGGVSLTPYGNETYGQTGSGIYDPGIKIGNAGGFYKRSATAALEPGTNDFNVFIVERIDVVTNDSNQVTYGTGIANSNVPGFEIAWVPAGGNTINQRRLFIRATDGTQVLSTITSAALTNAHRDGAVHSYETQWDRSGSVNVLLDGVSVGSVSIASLDGKSVTSTGVGIGQDYRFAVRNNQSTIFFIRQRHTLT